MHFQGVLFCSRIFATITIIINIIIINISFNQQGHVGGFFSRDRLLTAPRRRISQPRVKFNFRCTLSRLKGSKKNKPAQSPRGGNINNSYSRLKNLWPFQFMHERLLLLLLKRSREPEKEGSVSLLPPWKEKEAATFNYTTCCEVHSGTPAYGVN